MIQDWVNDWRRLGVTADVAPGTGKQIQVGNLSVALFNRDNEFFAASDSCGDCGGSISAGAIEDNAVFCPGCGRGYRFTSGSVSVERAQNRLYTYPVMVVDDDVFALIEKLPKSARP